MNDISFEEIRRKIASFFDQDMNPDDKDQFLDSIKKDPASSSEFDHEKNIRQKLRQLANRPSVPQGFVDQIRNKVGF
ncbi:MAG: hypothetical protein M3Q56_12815 [Bacteroidota bacterium]|nr:hypothetical protein [Bacteroidota bacterium]